MEIKLSDSRNHWPSLPPRHKLKSAKEDFLSSRETAFAFAVPPPLHRSLIIALTHSRSGKNIHFCRLIPISDDDGRCIFSEEEGGMKEGRRCLWNSVFPFRSGRPLLFAVMKEGGERTCFSFTALAQDSGSGHKFIEI